MPIIWGQYFTDEEVYQLAEELNRVGLSIEEKTKGMAEWVKKADELKQANPHGLVF